MRRDGANYKYTHNGKEYTLSGMTLNRATGVLDVTNLQITPQADIDFSALKLSIRGTTEENTIALYKDKDIQINLVGITVDLDITNRQPVLCAYNTAGGGTLQRILNQTYDREHETMEREAVFAALRKNDPSNKLDSLSTEQQQEAYRVLRRLYSPLGRNMGRSTMVNYSTG